MRALLFKNLTSQDHRRKIIASAEVIERQGTRTEIHRHLVCFAKEVEVAKEKIVPCIYVTKKCDSHTQSESFLCRLKGGVYVKAGERIFLINFIHSLKIHLTSYPTPIV